MQADPPVPLVAEDVETWWHRIQDKYGGNSRMELARWFLARRASA